MAHEDWEKNPDGDIKLCPLTGFNIFSPYEMYCGLRLRYNDGEEPQALQLVMSIHTARELAQALNEAADFVEQPPRDETRQ